MANVKFGDYVQLRHVRQQAALLKLKECFD